MSSMRFRYIFRSFGVVRLWNVWYRNNLVHSVVKRWRERATAAFRNRDGDENSTFKCDQGISDDELELHKKPTMEFPSGHHYWFFLMLGIYFTCSKLLFDKVYDASKIVIDEQFHIPQAQAYCDKKYDVWDTKITTLPGLYIAAANLVGPFAPCDTYNLRLFNFTMSIVNVIVLYLFTNATYGFVSSRFNVALQTINVALLPPLYFFSHVFYTDTFSITCLLLFILSTVHYYQAPILLLFGICAIFVRQTNCIWMGLVFIFMVLKTFIVSSRCYGNKYLQRRRSGKSFVAKVDPSSLKLAYDFNDLITAIKYHWETKGSGLGIFSFNRNNVRLFQIFLPNALFVAFVYVNGSIVVGDKAAHTMTVNFPQLLYFLLFYGFFGLPFILARLKSTLNLMLNHKLYVLLLSIVITLIVHYNTVVHPYLLADNRHYTFYIWNRWFGKYPYAVYYTIPAYIFLAFSLIDNLKDQNCISFLIAFYSCLIPGLCLQRLLEMRYFIIPYCIARLRLPKPSNLVVVCEFLWFVAINAATFYLFFTKEIMWVDFDEPQRIIW